MIEKKTVHITTLIAQATVTLQGDNENLGRENDEYLSKALFKEAHILIQNKVMQFYSYNISRIIL